MEITRALAGFSYGQADLFRRAISKKDAYKLKSLRNDFLAGCHARGVKDEVANKVFSFIERFADYGFNKSHSLCYAILACQEAYLKAHYPQEFYACLLDSLPNGDSKFTLLAAEMRRRGISFALPDINQAKSSYSVYGGKVMFGLSSIKGITASLANGIVLERQAKPYEDIFDFALRVLKYGLNAQNLVRLIDAGCFDGFAFNRATLRLSAAPAINYAELLGGGDLLLDLGIPKPSLTLLREEDGDLDAEREALGVMVSGSPLSKKMDVIAKMGLQKVSSLLESEGTVEIAAILASVKTIRTKKGTRMAFLLFYDEEMELEATMWGDLYDKAYPLLKQGALLHLSVKKDRYKEGSYVIEDAKAL